MVGWGLNGWDPTNSAVVSLSHKLGVGHGFISSHRLSVEPLPEPVMPPSAYADTPTDGQASSYADKVWTATALAAAAMDRKTPAELSPVLHIPVDGLLGSQAMSEAVVEPALTEPPAEPAAELPSEAMPETEAQPTSTSTVLEPAASEPVAITVQPAGVAAGQGEIGLAHGVRPSNVQWTGTPVRTWSDVWPAIPDTYGAEAGCAPGCTTYGVCNEVS